MPSWLDATLEEIVPDESQRAMALTSIRARADKLAAVALAAKLSGQSLEPYGVANDVADLPPAELVPLLREMIEARAVGKMDEALRIKPPESHSPSLPALLMHEDAGAATAAAEEPDDGLVALVVVARFREDVGWLARLPPRTGYHVIQKAELSPSLPSDAQTLAPNVGRESHSFLTHLIRLVREHTDGRARLPALVVCAQGDPFDHNPAFLDDVATLVTLAAADRAPLWTPLSLWQGGERLVYCDQSGAPHQSLLLPIARTWRVLFGAARAPPLWLGFTPGANFAVTREALLRCPLPRLEAALSPACALCEGPDPIAGHVFERLWAYLFLGDDADVARVFS